MSVTYISKPEEYDKLKKRGLVVVDFNTEWCGPCKRFAPVFEELSKSYPDVKFLSVDSEKIEHEDCKNFRTVPTFKVFLNGELKREFSGVDKAKLENYINRYSVQILFNGSVKRSFTKEEKERVIRYLEMFKEDVPSSTSSASSVSSSVSSKKEKERK